MDEPQQITDPSGKRKPMLDAQGNLTVDAVRLYAAGQLSAADVTAMDAQLALDPFAAEALAGFKGMAPDRFTDNMRQIDALLVERLGVEPDAKLEEDSPLWRMAATLLILCGVGGITWLGITYLPTLELGKGNIGQAETSTPATSPKGGVTEQARPTRPSFDVRGIPMQPAELAVVVDGTSAQSVPDTEPATQTLKTGVAVGGIAAPATKRVMAEDIETLPAQQPKALTLSRPAPTTMDDAPTASGLAANQERAVRTDAREMDAEQAESKKNKRGTNTEPQVAAAKRQSAMAEMVNQAPMSDEERSQLPLFNEVEQPPKFPGDDIAMYRYIESNRGYQNATGNGGNVYVSFVIDANGAVRNVEISRGINPDLDQDALRLVRAMPKWIPATKGGVPTSVRKTVMIKYR